VSVDKVSLTRCLSLLHQRYPYLLQGVIPLHEMLVTIDFHNTSI